MPQRRHEAAGSEQQYGGGFRDVSGRIDVTPLVPAIEVDRRWVAHGWHGHEHLERRRYGGQRLVPVQAEAVTRIGVESALASSGDVEHPAPLVAAIERRIVDMAVAAILVVEW